MPAQSPRPRDLVAASALSGHLDTRTAATEVAHMLHDALGTGADLLLVFASYHHRAAMPEAVRSMRAVLDPGTLLATTAESVLADDDELEGRAGLAALLMRLPGVRLHPWTTTPENPIPLSDPETAAARIGWSPDFRGAFLVGDPFTTPIARLLPALAACGGGRSVPIHGGMASGASRPGQNVLILDDRELEHGAIAVSISGAVTIDHVLSQGCRPIGPNFVVTKAQDHVVLELGGHPALDAAREVADALPDGERELIAGGLLLGTAIDERKRPLGRGDFLVRNLLGTDARRRALVAGDPPRVGQTVRLHVRDATTATEDLQLLLDAQQLHAPPFAMVLATCNGRGRRLFGRENHDLRIVRDRLGPIPIAGFFAAGEIGPVGARSFVHGHAASLVMLRRRLGTSVEDAS